MINKITPGLMDSILSGMKAKSYSYRHFYIDGPIRVDISREDKNQFGIPLTVEYFEMSELIGNLDVTGKHFIDIKGTILVITQTNQYVITVKGEFNDTGSFNYFFNFDKEILKRKFGQNFINYFNSDKFTGWRLIYDLAAEHIYDKRSDD